jgi:hypothetical protein
MRHEMGWHRVVTALVHVSFDCEESIWRNSASSEHDQRRPLWQNNGWLVHVIRHLIGVMATVCNSAMAQDEVVYAYARGAEPIAASRMRSCESFAQRISFGSSSLMILAIVAARQGC